MLLKHKRQPLAKLGSRFVVGMHHRSFSTNDTVDAEPATKEILVYDGKYSSKMKILKRISITSTICSMLYMPAAMTIESGVLPMVAQIALATTVFFTSFSSTVLLQAVGHTYVCTIHEIVPVSDYDEILDSSEDTEDSHDDAEHSDYEESDIEESEDQQNRVFKATTLSLFGNLKPTVFPLSDISKKVTNPFASFQLKSSGKHFYVYGDYVTDLSVRQTFTKVNE